MSPDLRPCVQQWRVWRGAVTGASEECRVPHTCSRPRPDCYLCVRRELNVQLRERGCQAADADRSALVHSGCVAGLSQSPIRDRLDLSRVDWGPFSERKHSKWVDQWYTRDAREIRRNR